MVITRDINYDCVYFYKQGLALSQIATIIKYKYDIRTKTESKKIVDHCVYCYAMKKGFCPVESEDL